MMREISFAAKQVQDSTTRQFRFQVLIYDVLGSAAPTIAQIVAGSATSAAGFSAFILDVTSFVDPPVNLSEPGDRRASRLTFNLLDTTRSFDPDFGANKRFLQLGQVVRLREGDTNLADADWANTFTGHIRGQVGFVQNRETFEFETRVSAYGRRATPKFLKQTFISRTYGRRIDLGTIVQEIGVQQMMLGSVELSRMPATLGKVTQFLANSIVELTPLEAVDKLLETVGLASDFDGSGILRAYSRDLQRSADKVYADLSLIQSYEVSEAEVEAYNSVSVTGLDKNINLIDQPEQALARATIPVGFWRPTHKVNVVWTNDRSLRARSTNMRILTSVNEGLVGGGIFQFGTESYTQINDFEGEIRVDISLYLATLLTLITATAIVWAAFGDIVVAIGSLTITVGRIAQQTLMTIVFLALSTVSSGQYEIYGLTNIPVYHQLAVVMTKQGVPDYLVHQKQLRNDFLNEQNELLDLARLELIFEEAQAKPRQFEILRQFDLEIGDIVTIPLDAGNVTIWIDSISVTIDREIIPTQRCTGYLVPTV